MKRFLACKIRVMVMFFFVCASVVCFYAAASAYATPPESTAQKEVTSAGSVENKESPAEKKESSTENKESPAEKKESSTENKESPTGSNSDNGWPSEENKGTCGTCTWEYKEEEYTEGVGPLAIKRSRVVFYLRPTDGKSGKLSAWKDNPPWYMDAWISEYFGDRYAYTRPSSHGRAERIVIEGKIKAETCYRMFADFSSVKSIEGFSNLDTKGVAHMGDMFKACCSLKKLDVGTLDTSTVKSMQRMFWNCHNLSSLDGIQGWKTGTVEHMGSLFGKCYSLASLDLSDWETNKVAAMDFMFQSCGSLTSIGDVSKWNTTAVKSMSRMFEGCSGFKALNLNAWNVAAVENMSEMFWRCYALEELAISKWNVKAVKNMASMFRSSGIKTLDLSTWNIKAVEDMSHMFEACFGLTSLNLGTWDTITARGNASGVISDGSELICQAKMTGMFLDTPYLKTIHVGHKFLFADDTGFGTVRFERSGSDNKTKVVGVGKYWMHVEGGTKDKPTGKFFPTAKAFLIFHNSLVRKQARGAEENQGNSFETYVRADTEEKIELDDIKDFYGGCEWEYVSKSHENGEKTYTLHIRPVEGKSNAGLLGDWPRHNKDWSRHDEDWLDHKKDSSCCHKDPSKAANPPWAGHLFSEYRLQTTKLVIEKGRTGIPVRITTGEGMFEDFQKLTDVDLSGLDTKGANSMARMFAYCSSLTSLDLKSWDVSSVKNMSSMFEDCRSLTTVISASDDGSQRWNTSLVENMCSMFKECGLLTKVNGMEYWNTAAAKTMHSMFQHCWSLSSFDLAHWKTSSETDMNEMFSRAWSIRAIRLGHDFHIKSDSGLFEVGQRFDNQWIQVKNGTQDSPKGKVFASIYDLMSFHNNHEGMNPEWYVKWSIQGVHEQYVWEYARSNKKGPDGRDVYVFVVRPLVGAPERVRRNIPEWKRRMLPPWEDSEYSKYYASTTRIVIEGDVKIDKTDSEGSSGEAAVGGDGFVKSVFAEGSFDWLKDLDTVDVGDLNIEGDDGVADIGNILESSPKVAHIRVNSDFEFGEPSGTSAKLLRFEDENGNPTGIKWAHVDGGTKEDPKGEVFDTFEKLRDFQQNIKNKARRPDRAKRSVEQPAGQSAEEPVKKLVEYVVVKCSSSAGDANNVSEIKQEPANPPASSQNNVEKEQQKPVGLPASAKSAIVNRDQKELVGPPASAKSEVVKDKPKSISVSINDESKPIAVRTERASTSSGGGGNVAVSTPRQASASPAAKPASVPKSSAGWCKVVKDGQSRWCYRGATGGVKLTGRHELVGGKDGGKHWFCFDENGFQIRGWNLTGNTWYYYSTEDGAMLKGQHELVGGKNGGKNWFYFDETTGTQVRGWKYIDSQKKWCYYSTEDGAMLKGQHELVGGDNGGKNWFYFDEVTGAELRSCWKEIPSQGKTCYYGPDGAMYKGLRVIDGREYYFNEETGAVQ